MRLCLSVTRIVQFQEEKAHNALEFTRYFIRSIESKKLTILELHD